MPIYKTVVDYLHSVRKSGRVDESISGRFQELYRNRIYDKLRDYKEIYEDDELLKSASIYSFMDSQLNCLRNPLAYPNECNRILRFVFSAFHSVEKNLKLDGKQFLFNNPEKLNVSKRRARLASFLNNATYDLSNDATQYYSLLGSLKTSNTIRLVTTNYTRIAECEMGLGKDSVAYIHGRLDLFEDLQTKEVGTLRRWGKKTNILFPFIFVPTGVKPIVHPYQMREMEKARRFILRSDHLAVLGFDLFGVDEHVRTIVRERLNRNKEVHVFQYMDKKGALEQAIGKAKDTFGNKSKLILLYGFGSPEKEISSPSFESVFQEFCKSIGMEA